MDTAGEPDLVHRLLAMDGTAFAPTGVEPGGNLWFTVHDRLTDAATYLRDVAGGRPGARRGRHRCGPGPRRPPDKSLFHEQKKCFLSRLISRICDCVRNLFSGFGLKKTTTLASELCLHLAPPTPKPPITKPEPADKPKSLSQESIKQEPQEKPTPKDPTPIELPAAKTPGALL